ncbi:MAG: hypothetical protein JO202_18235 [Ktedonobacteraceae bacterium]|nr:hypothetical protein [Ktedonobacteraceae bacterium]
MATTRDRHYYTHCDVPACMVVVALAATMSPAIALPPRESTWLPHD